MHENVIRIGIIAITLIVGIPTCFYLDEALHKQAPEAKPFKWGYYFTVGGAAGNLLWALAFIYRALYAQGMHFYILLLLALIMVISACVNALAMQRQRWALVTAVILQCNPIFWIINAIYLKNRWRELAPSGAPRAAAQADGERVV